MDIIFGKYLNGSLNLEETILELRAGGFYDYGTLDFIIFMFSLHQGDSFQSIPLSHQDPFGWLNGKYDRKPTPPISYKSSKFQLEMAGVTDEMCPSPEMADENGFVMSYQEAQNLVAETYSRYLEVNENYKITDWQAAKHMYHASGMGVYLSKYGFTQQELEWIRGEAQ